MGRHRSPLVLTVLALLVATCSASLSEHPSGPLNKATPKEEVVIDGKNVTIGLTVADYFSGALAEPFGVVTIIIVGVLSPATPEEDIDYFELIKEDVEQIVGEYINQHNMDQIVAYKDDLASLLLRYSEAPIESETYPDKNTMANSLSTSIVANRFLIEAVEWPHSMMLHFADIASIHLMVLEDAAMVYTTDSEKPSLWWVDLDNELEHYIQYGRTLEDTVVDWRNDMMECTFAECTKDSTKKICYDVWTVTDHVDELQDDCIAVHDDTSCDDHCQAYQINMNREVSMFVYYYLGRVMTEWENLKLLSAEMAAIAQP